MENGMRLDEAIRKGYVQKLWLRVGNTKNKYFESISHLPDFFSQVMEFDEFVSNRLCDYVIPPEYLVNASDKVVQEEFFESLKKRSVDELEKGRVLLESCTAFGKLSKTDDGVNYLKPWDADALEPEDMPPFLAISQCILQDMLEVIGKEFHTTNEEMNPKPLALVYHWNATDQEGMPLCAHFHLLITAKIKGKEVTL